jgi:hypothetical protein
VKNIFQITVLSISVAPLFVQAIPFDDEIAWQAAAGAFKQETFDDTETLSNNPIALGMQLTELPSLGLKLDNPGYIYDGSNGGPRKSEPFSLINVYPYNSSLLPPISFSPREQGSLITAVGFYNSSGDDTLIVKFLDSSGNLIESTTVGASQSAPIFGGLINTQGAAKVTIEGTGDANKWIAIDNLQITVVNLGLSDNCWAIYENGNLHIPCIKVRTPFGELKYEADMQYIPLSEPMNFQVTGAQEKD